MKTQMKILGSQKGVHLVAELNGNLISMDKTYATISVDKYGMRHFKFGIQFPKEGECESYTIVSLSDEEKSMIEMISESNVVKIQAILRNYY